MATRLQLRDTAASEPMPNVKQSADTVDRDVAASVATYANPADMLVDVGAATQQNSSTAAEPGSAHYTHYGSFISPKLAAQNVSGTVTIALVMAEGSVSANANPRVKIYKWLANDTFGSDLLALTTSALECPAAYPVAPIVYFDATAITSTDFALNDRIVIEIETYDNSTKTASYLHGIRFGGADTNAYGGYVEFSATLTWPGDGNLTLQSVAGIANLANLNIATPGRLTLQSVAGIASLPTVNVSSPGYITPGAVAGIASVANMVVGAIFSPLTLQSVAGVASLGNVEILAGGGLLTLQNALGVASLPNVEVGTPLVTLQPIAGITSVANLEVTAPTGDGEERGLLLGLGG